MALFVSDEELTVLVLCEVNFIRMVMLFVKLAICRFLVWITEILAATSHASTTTVLPLVAMGTLKLLSALANPLEELSWSHITMLLGVEAWLMMLD